MFKFGSLFGEEKQKTEEAVLEQIQPEIPEAEDLSPETPLAPAIGPHAFTAEGPLADLWRIWRGEETPPMFSLTGGCSLEELFMEPGSMDMELVRLKLKLEKEAKLRLQQLPTGEEDKELPPLAAECCCVTAKNKHLAWLFVFPPVGSGEGLFEEDVRKALQKAKVTTGIDEAAVQLALQPFHAFELIPVAVGIPPIEGEDGKIIEHYPREVTNKVAVNEDGTADYRAQSFMQVIAAGDLICDIIPPVDGTAGQTVEGLPIKPKSVHAAHVPKGAGMMFSEDGLHMLAAQDGYLEYKNNCFNIQQALTISGDVDYSTGNVNFPGNIHVTGNIREGFQVVAGGSLMVDGLVEGAEIAAGTDLIITKGVVGDNRAHLRCGGNLRAKFLENCIACVGKSLYADCTVNSTINCDNSAYVLTDRGSIIGGAVTAGVMIQAKVIGARSGHATKLSLGQRPYIENILSVYDRKLAEIDAQVAKVAESFQKLHADKKITDEVRKEKLAEMRKLLEALKENQEGVLKQREELAPPALDLNQCRIECDTIYPNTHIAVGRALCSIDTVRNCYKVAYCKRLGELVDQITSVGTPETP